MIDKAIIRLNYFFHTLYVKFLGKLVEQNNFDKAAESIESLAFLYSRSYCGFLNCPKLEKLLLQIGRSTISGLEGKSVESSGNESMFKILHVATELYDVGGHSRVIIDWVHHDKQNSNSIFLTHQTSHFDLVINAPLTASKANSLIEKAKELRNFVLNGSYDKIVIHQHQYDVVPTLAFHDFKSTASCPEIIFYNHADYSFSLGNIIADKRVSFSSGHLNYSKKHRIQVSQEFLLPFVLELDSDSFENSEPIEPKDESRYTFLVIASKHKLAPIEGVNFLKEWNAFLRDRKDARLIVVGTNEMDFKKFCPDGDLCDNIHLMGEDPDPTKYYKKAHYVLNSYPIPTGLGVYDGMAFNNVPILSYCNILATAAAARTLYPTEFVKEMSHADQDQYFGFIEMELNTGRLRNRSKEIITEFQKKRSRSKWKLELQELLAKDPRQPYPNDNSKLLGDKPQYLILTKDSINWYHYRTNSRWSIKLLDFYREGKITITGSHQKIFQLGLLLFYPLQTSKRLLRKIMR